MEFKRKTEIFVETKRRFVISQPEFTEQIFCPQCGAVMLAAEQAAAMFGKSCRSVYKTIETGAAHFTETETGAAMVCLAAIADILQVNDLPAAPLTETARTIEKQEEENDE